MRPYGSSYLICRQSKPIIFYNKTPSPFNRQAGTRCLPMIDVRTDACSVPRHVVPKGRATGRVMPLHRRSGDPPSWGGGGIVSAQEPTESQPEVPPPICGTSICPIDSLASVGRMEGEGLTNRTQSENPITVVGMKVAINFLACSLQSVTDHSLDCSPSPFFAPKAHHVS